MFRAQVPKGAQAAFFADAPASPHGHGLVFSWRSINQNPTWAFRTSAGFLLGFRPGRKQAYCAPTVLLFYALKASRAHAAFGIFRARQTYDTQEGNSELPLPNLGV